MALVGRLLLQFPCLYVLIPEILGKDVLKRSLKRSQKVKNISAKTSVELSS